MKLNITGTSVLQTVSPTNKATTTDTIQEYKEKCYNLQSMVVVGSKAYCIKVNKYGDDPDNMTTDRGEIHIFPDYSKNSHKVIEMGNNILGHANGVAYYDGALYVAVSSKGLPESKQIVKATLNASETSVTSTQGYTLYDAVAGKVLSGITVRGITHYRDNQFIIMTNPKLGVEYVNSNDGKFLNMQFKIGTFNDSLKRFEFTHTFFGKNTGQAITQDIFYSSSNKRMYIVTCNEQIRDSTNKVTVFMTKNTVLELDFENTKASKKVFAGTTYDYFIPSNKIILNKLNTDQKIFEMQSCCIDELKKRLVYAVDRKYTVSGARVEGEIYMVNNLYTKL